MAFPATTLPLVSELLISGTWTDVTADIRTADGQGVSITRGRADESSQVSASTSGLTFDNRSGNYSNRLPTSPYYGLLGRNTQLRHRIRWVYAAFTATASSAWPTADTGQAWTLSGGSASDYAASSGAGTQTNTDANNFRRAIVETGISDQDILVDCSLAITNASAAEVRHWVAGRYVDTNNHYTAYLALTTAGAVTLTVAKRVAGTLTVLSGPTTVGTGHAGGDVWRVRVRLKGTRFNAKAWMPSAGAEPVSWTLTSVATEATLAAGTKAALMSRRETGNTNANPVFSFDNFDACSYRFWGEVPAWPVAWDVSENDVTTAISAAGILRRLGSRTKALRSALFRTMSGVAPGDYVPHVYWPMEDGSDATRFASGLSGGTALPIPGGATPAGLDGPTGSESLAQLGAGVRLPFTIPAYTSTQIAFQWQLRMPSEPAAEMTLAEFYASSGPVRRWKVSCVPGTPAAVWVRDYDSVGTEINASGVNIDGFGVLNPTEAEVFGNWVTMLFAPQQTGGSVSSWLGIAAHPPGGAPGGANVDAGTLGTVTNGFLYGGESGVGVGHLGAYTDTAFDLGFTGEAPKANVLAMDGYNGETAAARLARLCFEHGIYFELIGTASDTAPMGPQRPGKLLDLLVECGAADLGILHEPRDAFGLAYRTRTSLYNQTGLALDYDSAQVFPPFQPVEDDQQVRNDVTTTREGGSSARVEITDGALSTQDPPDGIGVYDESVSVNVEADDQLEQVAGWLAHLGTWDEARYPTITADLSADAFSASPTLTGQAVAVDIGDYLAVTNPPAWLPPDDIALLAQGSSEFLAQYDWTITWNTVPAGPYSVAVYDDTAKRYSSLSTTTAEVLDTTETGVDISLASGTGWVTGSAAPTFPFDINIGGERMTVTANTSTGASTYTMTVTRSVNGVVKSHSSGVPVHIWQPAVYAY